jgi:hypothetical protein
MKTATKTASTKPALLSNGVTINVPEFVNQGERVRVNPNTGEYLERATESPLAMLARPEGLAPRCEAFYLE